MSDFEGHYVPWRKARLEVITNHFGKDWFVGKKILELGAGYGHISDFFLKLGADPLAVEGRSGNIHEGKVKHPGVNFVQMDLNKDFPGGIFDLSLNMGLLYHLTNWKECLTKTLQSSDLCVIETEVLDSDEILEVNGADGAGGDQALDKDVRHFTAKLVEEVITTCGHEFEMVTEGLEVPHHTYNWKTGNTKNYVWGLRRFWFTKKVNHG